MDRTLIAIRHARDEDLDGLEPALLARGYRIDYRDAGRDGLDGADTADLVVVLGGPFAAYHDDRHGFLADELRLIERRLATSRPLLGICVGAQLVARALGARGYAGGRAEIGWSPVCMTAEGRAGPLGAIADLSVLHWHGDTFDLPAGAVQLASTRHYANQAFAVGASVLGLQFHLAATAEGFERWLDVDAGDLARYDIDPSALWTDASVHAPRLAAHARTVIDKWLDGCSNLGETISM